MGIIASAKDIPLLLIYAAVVVLLTAGVCLTLGRLLERKSRAFARFVCCLFVPVLGFAGGFVLVAFAPTEPPPNDGPAMAAFAIWILSAFSLPICIVTSFVSFAVMKRNVR